jgi:YbgC/YbaW family acyl-CoA thioester hydrolase
MSTNVDLRRQDFRFFHRLRVRWAEVDMQKIVFNGHYLMYLDTAIADYWRSMAIPYEAAMHQLGGDLYVKKAGLEYHTSARYDDVLDIGLKCARIGNSSMQFVAGIFSGDQLLITGELIYVYADPVSQTSRPVPQNLRDIMNGFEAGEPMYEIRLGNWKELEKEARQLRTEVFLEEQKVPVEMEWDELDATAVHAVAFNRMGMPVATGRLLQPQKGEESGTVRIGRMAVTRVLRGTGLGRDILLALMQRARDQGQRKVVLHAQRSAEGFYQRQGYVVQGEPFVEAGIDHIEMHCKL